VNCGARGRMTQPFDLVARCVGTFTVDAVQDLVGGLGPGRSRRRERPANRTQPIAPTAADYLKKLARPGYERTIPTLRVPDRRRHRDGHGGPDHRGDLGGGGGIRRHCEHGGFGDLVPVRLALDGSGGATGDSWHLLGGCRGEGVADGQHQPGEQGQRGGGGGSDPSSTRGGDSWGRVPCQVWFGGGFRGTNRL